MQNTGNTQLSNTFFGCTSILCGLLMPFTGFTIRPMAADDPALAITRETQTRLPQLLLNGAAGTSCRLEYAESLAAPMNWQLLSNVSLTTSSALIVDRSATSLQTRFYRTARSSAPGDTNLLLWLKFEGNLLGAGGETPLSQQGFTYTTGKVGQAVQLDATGHLRYPVANNLDSREGTIEFWVQPNWDGSAKDIRVFFEAGDNFNNGIFLSKDGASNLRFLQWGDDPTTPAVEVTTERGLGFTGLNWVKGQWYHLAATWKGATRELAYYLNGEMMTSATNGVNLPKVSTTFFVIGAEIDNSHPAAAAFDELRIYNRMRTPDEIWKDYQYAGAQ